MKTASVTINNTTFGVAVDAREFKLGFYAALHAFQVNLGFVHLLMFHRKECIEHVKKQVMENLTPEEILSKGWHDMEITPPEGPVLIAFYGKVDGFGNTCDIKQGWMENGCLRCEKPKEEMKPFAWMHIDLPNINPFETEDGNEGDEE